MHLSHQLKTCSDQDWHNAVLVALAAHKDTRIKNLASEFSTEEIERIAIDTPVALLLTAGMAVDAAFKAFKNSKGDHPEIETLATELKQQIADKQQLDAFLTVPSCRNKQNNVHHI